MASLKLSAITDDKPIKVTVELPAQLHRDLSTYAQALIVPMLERFIASDRGFAKFRRQSADEKATASVGG